MKVKFESFNSGKETKIVCTFGAIKRIYEEFPELIDGKEMSNVRNMEYLVKSIYHFIQADNKPPIEDFLDKFTATDIRVAADVVPAAINGFDSLEDWFAFIKEASGEAKKN